MPAPIAFIQFDPGLGWWSPFTFWTVVISVILTLGFTVAVMIGGIGDLRYLLKAMDEEPVDVADDGRVELPPAEQGQRKR
jgi:hypothetical protein